MGNNTRNLFFFLLLQIIRYSFFGMKEALGFTPSWLLWLRYRLCNLCPLNGKRVMAFFY
jgi:hypothetical protein